MSYKLFYEDNVLDNKTKLNQYNIQNSAVLQLCEDKIIFVKRVSSAKFKIIVDKSDTIKMVKIKINQHLGHYYLPCDKIRLYFHGTFLEDSETLADYNIGYGMKVDLEAGKKIHVSFSFKPKTTYELQRRDDVKKLKEAINKQLRIPVELVD